MFRCQEEEDEESGIDNCTFCRVGVHRSSMYFRIITFSTAGRENPTLLIVLCWHFGTLQKNAQSVVFPRERHKKAGAN